MVSFHLILSVLLFSIFMYHFQWIVPDLHDSLPWLAGSRIIHTLISKSCFFNTFLDLKTKNQNLIDIMKTVAADIDFQYLSCEMSLMYYLLGRMICRGRCINIEGMNLIRGKCVVAFAKKIIRANGTFIAQKLWFQQTFVSRKRNSLIGKLVFKAKINSG